MAVRSFRLLFLGLIGVSTLLLAMFPACGPQAPSTQTPLPPALPPVVTPIGNQPPVITSLTPETKSANPGQNVKVQVVASDPEGEIPNLRWDSTGGSFTGAGNVVTWTAPTIYGTYEVIVTASDSKGAQSRTSTVISVSANQNPTINSLTPDPGAVRPGPGAGSSSIITCTAVDPDGDVLSYEWMPSEGQITGVGNKVTWGAPSREGDYTVKVVVRDGKGGSSTGQVLVRVSASESTSTMSFIRDYSGMVRSDGMVDVSRFLVGDDEGNRGMRCYYSFNISPIASKQITSAKLQFETPSMVGNPFSGGKLLRISRVMLGARGLQPMDFDTASGGGDLGNPQSAPPNVIDVTREVAFAASAAASLFQLRCSFDIRTDGNNVSDYIEFRTATLTVTYKN